MINPANSGRVCAVFIYRLVACPDRYFSGSISVGTPPVSLLWVRHSARSDCGPHSFLSLSISTRVPRIYSFLQRTATRHAAAIPPTTPRRPPPLRRWARHSHWPTVTEAQFLEINSLTRSPLRVSPQRIKPSAPPPNIPMAFRVPTSQQMA